MSATVSNCQQSPATTQDSVAPTPTCPQCRSSVDTVHVVFRGNSNPEDVWQCQGCKYTFIPRLISASPASSAVAFQHLVDAELRTARALYPERDRHLEAAAYIREKFEDYWQAVKVRVLGRDVRPLLRSLVQLAAMAQRAAEDLRLAERACGVALAFADQVADQLPELHRCLHRPLKTSHAAAAWLRMAVDRYESAVELGVPHKSPQLALEQLVIIAGCCRVVAEDLRYLERIDQPTESTAPALQLEAECTWCHSRDTLRQLEHEHGPALNEWRCRSCGRTFFPLDVPRTNQAS